MEDLVDYVLYRIKKQLNDSTFRTVDIELQITLPCGCCSECRFYSEDKEELLGKTDAQLINNFEMMSGTTLNHDDWYCHADESISIDLS